MNFIYLILVSMILTFQGELISYELIESFTKDEVQQSVDSDLGVVAPEIMYDVVMYKLKYNTIDPYGNETIASGVIA